MYLPVKPIFKILYRPKAALQELEVEKKFTVLDSLLVYVVLGTLNSWLYLAGVLPWLDSYGLLAVFLLSFPLNVLAAHSLNFSSRYMFNKGISPGLILFFMVSTQIVTAVVNIVYFAFSVVFGALPLLRLVLVGFACIITLLIVLMGVSELSGLGFADSALVYLFSFLVIIAVAASAIGAAVIPLIIINLAYGGI